MIRWLKQTFELSHGDHRAILSMEGVRGFAVFLVFLVHYVTLVMPWLEASTATHAIATSIETIGHLGVDLFFVLSGYLIYGMLITKPRPLGRYAVRRVQRIYPTFAAVFVLYLVLSAVFPAESKIPGGFEGVVYVLQNALLLPGIFDIEPMITVAWSLSYEAFAYLTIPLMIGLFSMRSMPRLQRIMCLLAVSIMLFLVSTTWLGHIRLTMFLCGMLVFEAIDAGAMRWLRGWSLPALAGALGITIAAPWLGLRTWGLFPCLFVLFFVFCLGCLSGGIAARLFTLAPLRWLGNMSYSYYLIHGLALKGFLSALAMAYLPAAGGAGFFWLLLPVAFAATLIPSAVLFIAVEKPFSLTMRAKRPSAVPKSATAAAAICR